MNVDEPTPPLRAHLSEAFHSWLPPLFDEPVPPERRATCDTCAMCGTERDAARERRAFFEPNVKCCSYHPMLPSFVVGALLADARPELDEGRRRLRARIAAQHGVSPRGVDGPPSYWLTYQKASSAFGRSTALLCPFFDDGRCTIWRYREGVCSTYFCKFEAGAEGHAFWHAVRDYLTELGSALASHAMLELGFAPEQALAGSPREVLPEELDAKPLPAAVYAARWGAYAGREESFFGDAQRVIASLDAQGAAQVGGVRLRARLAQVERTYRAMMTPALPARLSRNPALRVWSDGAGGHLLEGYSPMDPSRVSTKVLRVIDAFDGRTLDEIAAAQRACGAPVPSQALVTKLYRHRVLVDAGTDLPTARPSPRDE